MTAAIRKGRKAVWLTKDKRGWMRINYYNPKTSFWGGSSPVEKCGAFRYRTFVYRGGNVQLKEIGEDAVTWVHRGLANAAGQTPSAIIGEPK